MQYYHRENHGQGTAPRKFLCKDCEGGKATYDTNIKQFSTCRNCGLPIENGKHHCSEKSCIQGRFKKARKEPTAQTEVQPAMEPISLDDSVYVVVSDTPDVKEIDTKTSPEKKPIERNRKKGEKKLKVSKGKELQSSSAPNDKPKIGRSTKPKRSSSSRKRKSKKVQIEERHIFERPEWIHSPKHALEMALLFYENAKPDAFDNGVVKEGVDEGSSKARALYDELKLYTSTISE
jgi:hypothetical protein